MTRTVRVLMIVAALTLLAASAVHGGLLGPIDPFPGAAVPEAVIGVVLGAATAVTTFTSRGSWTIAFSATLFAIVGTLFGLSVTVPRGEPGDIAYHLCLLAILAITGGVLLAQRRRA